MAAQNDHPRALVSSFMAPVFTLVYPGESAGFESSAEWARIAGELEQQEKSEDQEKNEDEDKKDSSTSSDVKFFRVDQADEDGGEPMRWLFPVSSELIKQERSYEEAPTGTLLERKMADELKSLYCLYGSQEVARLGDSIGISYFANLHAFDNHYAEGTREKEEQFEQRTDVLAAVKMVSSVYARQLDALLGRAKEHQKEVTVAATKVAYAKLEEARNEILTETTRYIALPRKTLVNAQKALETDAASLNYHVVGGADFRNLLDAVERINSRGLAVYNPPPARPGVFALLNPLATSPAEDAAHALEYEISQACQRFPVLHRTWKALSLGPYVLYERVIFGALRDAWAANERLRDRIANEPEIVWDFPALIHETLESLSEENPDYGDLEVGARAAQELLEQSTTGIRITETLAKIVGLLDLAAAVTSPAPPVALGIAGASVVFSLADSLIEYQQLSAKDDAANATLDPRKALSSDPSYFFFALGIAFSLLDLKGLPKAYRAARVTREVDELGNLVKEGI